MALTALSVPLAYRTFMRSYLDKRVVELESRNGPTFQTTYGGTGFYVKAPSGKTYIMTNRHLCAGSADGTLWINAQPAVQVKIIVQSDQSDLCLLEPKADTEGLLVADKVFIGQPIHYMGHPRLQPATMVTGEAVGMQDMKVHLGIIGTELTIDQCQGKDNFIESVSQYQGIFDDYPELRDVYIFRGGHRIQMCYEKDTAMITTLTSAGGASGSPVVDIFGRVIGVMYSGFRQEWGYAVTLKDVKQFLSGR